MTAVLAGIIGVLIGAVLVVLIAYLPPDGWTWLSRRRPAVVLPPTEVTTPAANLALAILDQLPTATIVLNQADEIMFANGAAASTGMVKGNRLTNAELRDQARKTRRDGRIREAELDLARGEVTRGPLAVRARIVPVGGGDVVVIVDDLTESRRIDAVRRDFVANISHELKTPVGAISLLAEAVAESTDDPVTVSRFVGRIQHESARLTRLVQELIDLSRLQGAEPLPEVRPVSMRMIVGEAVDRARLAAQTKQIRVVFDETDARVMGDEPLLVTAMGNLIDNAVAYSPENTRVAVAIRATQDAVEVSVTDQGIGIAAGDVDRIFERFYRVDPARSRATGGTGLGLAIVKHIVTNHGGTISVWSTPGAGSTFTVRLPAAPAALTPSLEASA
ncbi:MAG: two-component system, OmpR family, sensor histidine kinase SenX3 [Frankiales bacterium]|nr:two-component system, OmpR family, sensor histidine kinase SenX3 [Frankiales bacterium]